ncbi:hypothetical protein N657DRAFT_3467 [Parathielavia appendiculata]|uniref:Uncharacterized protein n=1 Tax=Parathielavia appendiculata TaxID=2587402 RepID=A0AAN6U8A7_9PEZI|nr:hypothetical protein N657DRAFT_3467 [Parathielavia appendiculata]
MDILLPGCRRSQGKQRVTIREPSVSANSPPGRGESLHTSTHVIRCVVSRVPSPDAGLTESTLELYYRGPGRAHGGGAVEYGLSVRGRIRRQMSGPIARRNHRLADSPPASPHGLPVVLAAVVVPSAHGMLSATARHRMASRQDVWCCQRERARLSCAECFAKRRKGKAMMLSKFGTQAAAL